MTDQEIEERYSHMDNAEMWAEKRKLERSIATTKEDINRMTELLNQYQSLSIRGARLRNELAILDRQIAFTGKEVDLLFITNPPQTLLDNRSANLTDPLQTKASSGA